MLTILVYGTLVIGMLMSATECAVSMSESMVIGTSVRMIVLVVRRRSRYRTTCAIWCGDTLTSCSSVRLVITLWPDNVTMVRSAVRDMTYSTVTTSSELVQPRSAGRLFRVSTCLQDCV